MLVRLFPGPHVLLYDGVAQLYLLLHLNNVWILFILFRSWINTNYISCTYFFLDAIKYLDWFKETSIILTKFRTEIKIQSAVSNLHYSKTLQKAWVNLQVYLLCTREVAPSFICYLLKHEIYGN